jgi:hypothetical protein
LACSRFVYESLLAGDLPRATAAFAETWEALRLLVAPAAARAALADPILVAADTPEQNQLMQFSGRLMSQAFWRSEKNDFDELASARSFTEEGAGRRLVRLTIPPGVLGSQPKLRLDPVDRPGIAQLFAIRLLDTADTVLWEWDGLSSSLAAMDRRDVIVLERIDEAGVFLYLPTRDPSLLLPLDPVLDQISGPGGFLELDFAWRGTIYPITNW